MTWNGLSDWELSIEIMHEYTEAGDEKIRTLFASETGYQTPKVDVRGVIFQDGKLLVKEKADGAWRAGRMGGRRSIACRSCCEGSEGRSGLRRACRRSLAVLDKKFHNHPPSAFHVYKMFIQCDITGGAQAWGPRRPLSVFRQDELPPLSEERNTKEQLRECSNSRTTRICRLGWINTDNKGA